LRVSAARGLPERIAAGATLLKPRTHWRDGASHPLMLPLEFIQRPAFEAAVPWTAADLDLATREGRLCGVESRGAYSRFGSLLNLHRSLLGTWRRQLSTDVGFRLARTDTAGREETFAQLWMKVGDLTVTGRSMMHDGRRHTHSRHPDLEVRRPKADIGRPAAELGWRTLASAAAGPIRRPNVRRVLFLLHGLCHTCLRVSDMRRPVLAGRGRASLIRTLTA